MRRRSSNFILIGMLAFLLVFCSTLSIAQAQSVHNIASDGKKSETAEEDAVQIPEHLSPNMVHEIVAELSDEQVRDLLIRELKAQAALEVAAEKVKKPEGLAGFVQKAKNTVSVIRERIEFLKSGGKAAPEEIPAFFQMIGSGKKRSGDPVHNILSVAGVFMGAFLIECLFWFYAGAARRKIEDAPPDNWKVKSAVVLLKSILEIVLIAVFALAALVLFYIFLDHGGPQAILFAAYLAGILIIRALYVILRIILAPKAPLLRFLPISDDGAVYLFRWLMLIAAFWVLGLLTCGIVRLAGASEAVHFQLVTMIGAMIAAMLVLMIIGKRKEVAEVLEADWMGAMGKYWHHFAIFGVLVLLFLSVINRLISGQVNHSVLYTLLMVSLYFFLDWLLRRMLSVALGIAEKFESSAAANQAAGGQSEGEKEEESESEVRAESEAHNEKQEENQEKKSQQRRFSFERMRGVLRTGMRTALFALIIFWTLKIWGVNIPVGQAAARAVLEIIIVVLVCYVIWEIINSFIQKKLAEEMPMDDTDEKEEGGAGGSRIGTLLLLLRKFLMAVIVVMAVIITLSTIGVDIGPLIAGAGVLGLAIGFGAQTLVKDILAGVFFLIDDAFRLHDYIQTGSTKGMVEHISLRSVRLRHPRGMVNTIPFGSMGTITNFSRDYIITKLDFRVRYDANVEKIRKIIKKKVYEVIMKNEELAPKLLDKIKSQGVREMDDSAMIMRVKFKTIPGEQFVIRKEVYRLMQEAFRKEGIEFAHRNVTVYMPPDPGGAQAKDNDSKVAKKVKEAGAEAALSAIAEEEKKAAEMAKAKK